jgi:hypothetical protein
MAALTGILSASPVKIVAKKVKKYALIVGRSKMKGQKKSSGVDPTGTNRRGGRSPTRRK